MAQAPPQQQQQDKFNPLEVRETKKIALGNAEGFDRNIQLDPGFTRKYQILKHPRISSYLKFPLFREYNKRLLYLHIQIDKWKSIKFTEQQANNVNFLNEYNSKINDLILIYNYDYIKFNLLFKQYNRSFKTMDDVEKSLNYELYERKKGISKEEERMKFLFSFYIEDIDTESDSSDEENNDNPDMDLD